MSSHEEQPIKKTILSLAAELIIKIVRLSSPKPSWDNATERSAHLRNLALVCQSFREPAQNELFSHVVLRSIAASRAFVTVLKSDEGARFASTPRSLRAGTDEESRSGHARFPIPYLIERCSRLESMWLLKVHSLDFAALTLGTGLRELFCYGCAFRAGLGDRKLEGVSPLVRLGISDCAGVTSFPPELFPRIKSLDAGEPDTLEDGSSFEIVSALGRQLSSLCITTLFWALWDSDAVIEPNVLIGIFALDLRLPPSDVTPFLSALPSRIRHLRAQAPLWNPQATIRYNWTSEFIRGHLERSKYPSLESLKHFRSGTDDIDLEVLMAKEPQDELKALRPEVTFSSDEVPAPSSAKSVDSKFNPTFWAFVDDAEAAEERRAQGVE